jgi:CRAL/TRIO domain
MASTDGDHYPERLGTLIVINAPAVLSWAWKAIQSLLDDVQRAKIGIYGTDPNEWRPVLLKIVDRDQIPVSYGGPG